MSALAFLLLILFLVGLLALLYYGVLCYPVLAEKTLGYNSEHHYLLPLHHNDSEEPEAVSALCVEKEESASNHEVTDSLHEKKANDGKGLVFAVLDEPDFRRSAPAICEATLPSRGKLQQPYGGSRERQNAACLRGDEEDGLLLLSGVETKSSEAIFPDAHSDKTPSCPTANNGAQVRCDAVLPSSRSEAAMTVSHPLNAPCLVVAPVYDEPSIEEQVPIILQAQVRSVLLENSQQTTLKESEPKCDAVYGWNVNDSVEIVATDIGLNPLENLTKSANDSESPAPEALNSETSGQRSTSTSSSASPDITVRSKGSVTVSETSEPEVTEYILEAGKLCPTTRGVLEGEIGTSNQSVKMLRYLSIDENAVPLEADASVSDSIRVLVGDPEDPETLRTESLSGDEDDKNSPSKSAGSSIGLPEGDADTTASSEFADCAKSELSSRRSPDGVSMEDSDGEPSPKVASVEQNGTDANHRPSDEKIQKKTSTALRKDASDLCTVPKTA